MDMSHLQVSSDTVNYFLSGPVEMEIVFSFIHSFLVYALPLTNPREMIALGFFPIVVFFRATSPNQTPALVTSWRTSCSI